MVNIKVNIVIPWRETSSRIKIFEELIFRYKRDLPEYEIVLSDSGSDIFNVSASRNVGINQAVSSGADVVIVSDADYFIDSDFLKKAAELAYQTDDIIIPYSSVTYLKFESLDNFIKDDKDFLLQKEEGPYSKPEIIGEDAQTFWPCSGLLTISAKKFNEFGGFDENFIGYGFEDQAYHVKYYKKYQKLFTYLDGEAFSINHPRGEWKDELNATKNAEYFFKNYGGYH